MADRVSDDGRGLQKNSSTSVSLTLLGPFAQKKAGGVKRKRNSRNRAESIVERDKLIKPKADIE